MQLFSDQAGGARRHPRRRATTLSKEGSGRRGMALLMVLTSIAVLTTVVVEFAYDTRVDATLAANARDELRAHYLARSATNLSRLVLHFQHGVDAQGQQLQQMLGQATGGQVPGGGMPKIRLWELLPVESETINMFVGAAAGAPPEDIPEAPSDPRPGEAVPAAGLQMFGSYEGGFSASIEDEESKFNLNRLDVPGSPGAIAAAQVMMLWKDPRWDFLFDEDNLNGERFTREELLLHIKDWIDQDEVGSAIDRVSGQITAGFSDEAAAYTRYRPDYEPKNARFDTVLEAYLVAGVDDRIMAAFGDRFTVFPDINSEINVNTSDPLQQYTNILIAAENPDLPALQDPMVVESILQEIEMARLLGGFMGMSVQQFAAIVQGAGIPVKPEIINAPTNNNFFTDTSETFRIQATGTAGDVTRTITTVVRYDDKLGKLLYWRED